MDPRLNGLSLKTSLSALLDLVLPRVCVVCGRPLLPREQHLCLECLAALPETRYATLSHNPMADRFNAKVQVDEYEPYAYAAALYHYRADAGYKKISQALKYHRDFGTGRWAAGLLGERLAASPLYADVDLVVPVPLHWTRYWQRGYNQAAVIAQNILKETNVENLLKAKGFEECIATLSDEGCSVVVSGTLEASQTLIIQEVVMEQTGVTADKIKILGTA